MSSHSVEVGIKPPTFYSDFFDMNKVPVYIRSIQDDDGQRCVCLTYVKGYQNGETHTNKITHVFGIRNLLCLCLTEGGCLHGEDMDNTHH